MVRVPNLPLSMTASANVISGPSKRSSPLFYVAPRVGATHTREQEQALRNASGDALTLATSRSPPPERPPLVRRSASLVIHHRGPASCRPAPWVLDVQFFACIRSDVAPRSRHSRRGQPIGQPFPC